MRPGLGKWTLWKAGQGRELCKWRKAGGGSVNEVSEDNRRSDDSDGQERTSPEAFMLLFCFGLYAQTFRRGCRFTSILLFILVTKFILR